MKKQNTIFILIVLLLTGFTKTLRSQSIGAEEGMFCPGDFNAVSSSSYNIIGSSTPQSSFSGTAIIVCGNFRLYFEDLQQNTGGGFADPTTGAVRRNTKQ